MLARAGARPAKLGRVSAGRGKAGRIAVGLVGALALVLALAQLLLPGIAASRISSRVGRYGRVESVSVKAWPAVELLWGSADSVTVRAMSLTLSPAQTAKLLWEARGASRLELTAPSLREGPLKLTQASLRKHGQALAAQARISDADVRTALPAGLRVELLSSQAGAVRVRAGGGPFGAGASVDALAGASTGRLVVHGLGSPLSGLRLTLFSEPHVYVQGVSASVEAGQPLSYRLTINATLR
jgi:hypothetical protein